MLAEHGAATCADLLFSVNPARLIANESPLPVPPAERAIDGPIARLKRWFTS
jgi:hypothetical protein